VGLGGEEQGMQHAGCIVVSQAALASGAGVHERSPLARTRFCLMIAATFHACVLECQTRWEPRSLLRQPFHSKTTSHGTNPEIRSR